MILLLLLNLGLAIATETTVEVTIHELQVLSCWACQNTEGCIRMYNTSSVKAKQCAPVEQFCRVRTVTDEHGIKLLERACASSCTPGCKRAIRLQTCEQCCTTPLCNAGNEAERGRSRTILELFFLSFLITFECIL